MDIQRVKGNDELAMLLEAKRRTPVHTRKMKSISTFQMTSHGKISHTGGKKNCESATIEIQRVKGNEQLAMLLAAAKRRTPVQWNCENQPHEIGYRAEYRSKKHRQTCT